MSEDLNLSSEELAVELATNRGRERIAPEPQPQQGQVQLNIQVLPQGVMLSCAYPMQLGLPDETMDNLTEQWIMQRPQLLLKIVQKAKAAQKQELAIISHINRSKIN